MATTEKRPALRAVVIYWSKTGNTEKVARAVVEGLRAAEVEVTLQRVEDAAGTDWYDYDLVCLGFPSYSWRPPGPMDKYLNRTFQAYRGQGRVRVGAPPLPGKHGLVFCTYSGPHTGVREATPAVLYAGQFLEHVGFPVVGEWTVVGEFHGSEENSTLGRLGDVRGRPNEEDLADVRQRAAELVRGVRGKGPEA